jgi:hypothetical protein
MTDLDALIVSEFDRMYPLPGGGRADWQGVIDRVTLRRRRTKSNRRLAVFAAAVVAIVVIALATPVGAAIVRGLDDFAAWISGQPGKPVSRAEQQAFQKENERSWSDFAPGTKLRRLIRTSVDNNTYTLYGFRNGDELCLRLVASGVALSQTSTYCAPVQVLQGAKEPVLVLAADEPFGSTPEVATASFGIVSDGVTQVLLHADNGTHHALVASNAFLYVAGFPRPEVRVRSVQAVAGNGSIATLPFESAPCGFTDLPKPPKGTPKGPSKVDRHVHNGTIGWLLAHEPRGAPLPAKVRESHIIARLGYLFGRVIQPDPRSSERIALILVDGKVGGGKGPGLCLATWGVPLGVANGGTLCAGGAFIRWLKDNPFEAFPITSGAGQFALMWGIASDDVARLKLFLASGETVDVPLTDNVFFTEVDRAMYPIRLVAYDAEQRVIDVRTFQDDGMTNSAPPPARTSMRVRFRVSAADSTTAVVEAGDPAGGYRCWSIAYRRNGLSGGGCTPWPGDYTDNKGKYDPLMFISAELVVNDVFLDGQIPAQVASVTVSFPDGTVAHAKTQDGFLVYPIPLAEFAAGRTKLAIHAYDRSGAQIAQRGMGIRK